MIFISYSREDKSKVRAIAEAIRFRTDYELWRDVEIPVGQLFNREIGRALSNAKAAIVFWSKRSVESDWVIEEASRAKAAQKLIPVKIEDCEVPTGFGNLETIDLTQFTASPPYFDEDLSRLISALNRFEKLPPDKLTVYLSVDQSEQYEMMRRITGGVEVVIGMNPREAPANLPFETGLRLVGFTASLALEFGDYSGENVLPLLQDLNRAHVVILTFFPTLLVSPRFYEFLIEKSGNKPIFAFLFGPIEHETLISKYSFLSSVPGSRIVRRKGIGFPLDGEAAKETWKLLGTLLRSIDEDHTTQ